MHTRQMLAPLALAGAALACAAAVAGNITPSGPEVPANLLRIEVHFDRPLPNLPLTAVVLRDAEGRPIPDALLDIGLPDRDERNLVVLMHPGRVKQGVGANLSMGRALHVGQDVTIEVTDPRLPQPLRRTWHVGAAREARLEPAAWKLAVPAAGGKAPLVLALPSPINASAAPLIAVADAQGERIAGGVLLAPGETVWRFIPAAPWKAGRYHVRIHPALEDPAGNRLCAPFEEREQSADLCDTEASIGFSVGARSSHASSKI
jgi:hypothetical protein